jgi:hypothetical protein
MSNLKTLCPRGIREVGGFRGQRPEILSVREVGGDETKE